MPFPNSCYNDTFGLLGPEYLENECIFLKMWRDGAFDEFSDDHFMIRAFYEDREYFEEFFNNHYVQITDASFPYSSIGAFPGNFVVNLEKRFCRLVSAFGYDKIRQFVTDQLSAGKKNYSENAFFEALSEIHFLIFCLSGGMQTVFHYENDQIIIDEKPVGIVSCKYEPKLNGNKNPEASFLYEDGTELFVEMKTPNFNDVVDNNLPCLMPGVLIDRDGRALLKEMCKKEGIQCLLPNVSKMKDYFNSADDKFKEPTSSKQINLLCINWTDAEVDKNDITEPLIILTNPINGILTNPKIAEKCQISKDSLSKISAVLIYKLELGALLFSDFRYIFANRKAKVVLNRFVKNLDTHTIHRITKLSCIYPEESNISDTIYCNDICLSKFKEKIALVEEVVKDHILI